MRLNPCCSGIWSRTKHQPHVGKAACVLILVVVEYGLGREQQRTQGWKQDVLILVVVEYGLGQIKILSLWQSH